MNSKTDKSKFLTILSYIFIVLSGFILYSTISNIRMGMNVYEFLKNPCNNSDGKSIPTFICFIFYHIKLMIYIKTIIFSLALISSIGILLRKNWGRILFTVNLITGLIIFILISALISHYISIKTSYVTIFLNLLILMFSIFIIKKLFSEPIKNEF